MIKNWAKQQNYYSFENAATKNRGKPSNKAIFADTASQRYGNNNGA